MSIIYITNTRIVLTEKNCQETHRQKTINQYKTNKRSVKVTKCSTNINQSLLL